MLSDSTILKHIARQPKRAAGFKQLVRELGLHGDARGELDARLQKLVAAGELVQLNSDRYALPQPAAARSDKNLAVGRLSMHRDGFGFVIPDASSLSASLKSHLVGDIFIAPHAIGNAMHGDRVLVDIVAVRVVVEVEITEWPSPTENPRGRVLEILGYEDDFGVDVEIIIRKFHLPHHFPVEVLQEAQQFEPIIPAGQLHHRRDYRSLPIVTIDGETARDFDDAVTVRRMSNGNFELQVHIADVAHYVREESSIDLEARLRGTSFIFPTAPCPCCPSSFPPICAACARKWSAWCCRA
jgi:exoribonuclease R